MKNRIIVVTVLLVVVFLAGFLPLYAKANRLECELREARRGHGLAQLRDLACLAYFQAGQKDYGLAAGTSTRFFDRTREVANEGPDPSVRKPLEELLSLRTLQALSVKTRQTTAIPTGAPQPE